MSGSDQVNWWSLSYSGKGQRGYHGGRASLLEVWPLPTTLSYNQNKMAKYKGMPTSESVGVNKLNHQNFHFFCLFEKEISFKIKKINRNLLLPFHSIFVQYNVIILLLKADSMVNCQKCVITTFMKSDNTLLELFYITDKSMP